MILIQSVLPRGILLMIGGMSYGKAFMVMLLSECRIHYFWMRKNCADYITTSNDIMMSQATIKSCQVSADSWGSLLLHQLPAVR
jgi:hypothetical protein